MSPLLAHCAPYLHARALTLARAAAHARARCRLLTRPAPLVSSSCSDQNSVLVHVSVPNKHVPTVPVTLKPSECPVGKGGKVGPGKNGFKN